MASRTTVVLLTALAISSPREASAVTLPAQQITLSNDAKSQSWSNRTSPMSGGKILFVDSNDDVWFYNGSFIEPDPVQDAIAGQLVETAVFMLGASATPGQVIGGWRRGAGAGYVSFLDGATPAMVALNPESVSIRDGCVFMVLQTGAGGTGQHAFKINPANGSRQQVSSGVFAAGVTRVATSQCKAAWSYQPTNTDDPLLGFWDGVTETAPLDTNVSNPSFVGGKIVYTKVVNAVTGLEQVFLIDTTVSLTPVQVSAETDPTVTLRSPQTDGRHIAWYRMKRSDGSNPQLVVRGGLVYPTPSLQRIQNVEHAFQLDSGQLLWKTAAGGFQYDNGTQVYDLDPSPAVNANVFHPWLTDGSIAFLSITPTSGTDREVFRATGTAPLAQPQPPLLVSPVPGSAQVRWDPVIGATSYNAYVAYAPNVTKDNYASLPGGRKIENVTNGFTIPGIPFFTTYSVVITTVEAGNEGPSGRAGSTTFVGPMAWNAVGGFTGTSFTTVAADGANSSFVYAGAGGAVYKSSNGGIDWTQVLSAATTGSTIVRSLAVASPRVFANTNQGDIWRSLDNGAMWARRHDGTGNNARGGLVVDPSNPNVIYAGNFDSPDFLTLSKIIRSTDAGENWVHTAQGPSSPDEIDGNGLAAAATTPVTIFTGGNGTPNAAKTTNGAASWASAQITGGGQVNSFSVDPTNPSIVYASTRDKGVFKTVDGGSVWTAKNNGLAGVSGTFSGGAEFNSILVDPQNPNLLHLGAGNGYWFSLDAGESWQAANSGFPGTPYIYGLAMTPARRLIAATDNGLYLMSFGVAPAITAVSPTSGNTAGGTVVTITGTGFQTGATVTFGGAAAATVTVVSAASIVATTPAHAAGAVNVVVTNPDFQSATVAAGFTYTNVPDPPSNVTATAQTATSVLVSWSASASATSYQVYRKSPGGSFELVASPTGTSHSESRPEHTSHLYRVRAVNGSGSSADSAADLVTMMTFTDSPLTPGTTVKAIHFQEARMAIDHVRTLAGLGAGSYSETPAAGLVVKAIHVTQMRTALDAALSALALNVPPYLDPALTSVLIKAFHVQEVRQRMQ